MLAAIVLAALVAPTPVSTPTPLKEIMNVRSRALCTTLDERVRPAIAGLMQNDRVIAYGERALSAIGLDSVRGDSGLPDHSSLSIVRSALARNIATIDDILDAPNAFPAAPATNDDRTADDIKARLLAILSRQKTILNAIDGTVATAALGTMKTEFPLENPIANPSSASTLPGTQASPSVFAAAALDDPHVIGMGQLLDSDLIGATIYDNLSRLIAEHQAGTRAIEASASDEIVSAANACKVPAPAP